MSGKDRAPDERARRRRAETAQTPTDSEAAARRIALLTRPGPRPVQLRRGSTTVPVPPELVSTLRRAARALARGEPVTVVAGGRAEEQLSSQQAADLLNVSRPYVVKLARDGRLPHHKVGNRHRFARADVEAYQRREARRRSAVLAELSPAEGYQPDDF